MYIISIVFDYYTSSVGASQLSYSLSESYRYKTPFLRGEIDSKIDKCTKIEELMASDLDHWMCNLYFEVVRLPR